MDKALARASVTIELIEDIDKYEAQIISTNGTMLQPYDTSTTLIGTVLKNKVDITRTLTNVKWTKWNPSADDLIECPEWNEKHKGESIIQISKDDVDNKSIFMFEAYNNRDELLCSSSISIIDINDLLVSTKEPTDPYVGQLWIDDSEEPATIYVWNGYKWVVSGTVGAIAKNLLRNTNFFVDCKYWDIVGDKRNLYTPVPFEYLNHRFLKINSNVMTNDTRGITQTTTDVINKNSEYSFQMLYYSKEDSETFSNKITVNIYSIESNGEEAILYTTVLTTEPKLQQLYARFKTTQYTEAIKVEVLGEDAWRFNFCIAELALYNTWNNYPWTINPIDLNITNYTQEELWNILSNNGTVQGIFSQTNPETGQLDYYINASLITAGKLLAQYMDLYNLRVLNKETGEPTFAINEKGEVTLQSDNIKFASGESLLEITNKGVYLESDGSIVDISGNGISISSALIKLEGYTTINGNFHITEEGDMIASNGKFQGLMEASTIISTDIRSHENIDECVFTLDKDGKLTAKDAHIEGTISSTEIEGSTIYATEIYSDRTEDPAFSLDKDGILKARGAEISGHISGLVLEGETFKSASGLFAVENDGSLYAKNANFTGSITSGGSITGSTLIGSTIQNRLEDPSFTVDSEGTVTGATIHGGSIGIGNGEDYDAFTVDQNGNCNITKGSITIGENFKVTSTGDLTASNASFSGNITSGSTITGATIIGTTIQNGATFENSSFTVDKYGNIKGANLSGGSINIGDGVFVVDEQGNMTAQKGMFTGAIQSGSTITGSSIMSNNGEFSIDEYGNIKGGSINIEDKFIVTPEGKMEAIDGSFNGSIDCGNGKFVVTNQGELTATSANISGTITATDGKIAGYTISGSKLVGESVGLSGLNGEGLAFWAGSDVPGEAPFRVNHNGKFFATDAKISGTISGSDIEGGTIKIGRIGETSDYNFSVFEDGKVEIGGPTTYRIDNEPRSPLEITPSGVLYSVSDASTYTKISAGKIECRGTRKDAEGNTIKDSTIISNGAIETTKGIFTGEIRSGSSITGSTFNSTDNIFRVLDDGTVMTNDLTASGVVSASSLVADELDVPMYEPSLVQNITVSINESETSPDELVKGGTYASIPDLLAVCPRNLNSYRLTIDLASDITDNISIDGLNNGFVRFNMNGKTIKGYMYVKGTGLNFSLYGDKHGSTGSSVTNAKIIPNKGYMTDEGDGNRFFCLYLYVNRARIYNIDFYKDNSEKEQGGGNDYGICADGGTSLIAKDIRAVNKPYSLVRVVNNSSAFLERTAGVTSATSIQAIDGSIIHLADGNHAYGNAGGTKRVFTNNGSQIFYDSSAVKFVNTAANDTSSSSTNTTTGTTTAKTVTIKSTGGYSWRTSGSYANSWATEKVVREGQWSSSLGANRGYWFFGNGIYDILQNYTVTSVKIKITRQAGGSSSAVTHYLRAHTIGSKPSGTPSNHISSDTFSKSFSLAVGSSTTISLTAAQIKVLKDNKVKGFGLYGGSYSCCSPSCTVTITYKS